MAGAWGWKIEFQLELALLDEQRIDFAVQDPQLVVEPEIAARDQHGRHKGLAADLAHQKPGPCDGFTADNAAPRHADRAHRSDEGLHDLPFNDDVEPGLHPGVNDGSGLNASFDGSCPYRIHIPPRITRFPGYIGPFDNSADFDVARGATLFGRCLPRLHGSKMIVSPVSGRHCADHEHSSADTM